MERHEECVKETENNRSITKQENRYTERKDMQGAMQTNG